MRLCKGKRKKKIFVIDNTWLNEASQRKKKNNLDRKLEVIGQDHLIDDKGGKKNPNQN